MANYNRRSSGTEKAAVGWLRISLLISLIWSVALITGTVLGCIWLYQQVTAK